MVATWTGWGSFGHAADGVAVAGIEVEGAGAVAAGAAVVGSDGDDAAGFDPGSFLIQCCAASIVTAAGGHCSRWSETSETSIFFAENAC